MDDRKALDERNGRQETLQRMDERTGMPDGCPVFSWHGQPLSGLPEMAGARYRWAVSRLQRLRLAEAMEQGYPVERPHLVDFLNLAHFSGRPVLVQFVHPAQGEDRSEWVHPEPCSGERVVCRRLPGSQGKPWLRRCKEVQFLIDQGRAMVLAPAGLVQVTEDAIRAKLPEKGYVVGERENRRYPSRGVVAHMVQGDLMARGDLVDFSPSGFRVRMQPAYRALGERFDDQTAIRMRLHQENGVVYSGRCRCVSRRGSRWGRELVLIPLEPDPHDEGMGEIRNPRQCLTPSPTVTFEHPLLRRIVQLEVSNISTAGICVHEEPGEAFLVTGLTIPTLDIDFGTRHRLKARTRVVYRREEEMGVRCGLAIMDMSLENYSRLAHILTHALDRHTYLSSRVDPEEIWEFFFQSGFMYPEKYRRIQAGRGSLKETYQKLYTGKPEIARHFTYRRNGKVYGHMSMIRAYRRTWMIQHHAARKAGRLSPGFVVLKQIMQYLQDIHRLPSAETSHVMCYFRPENRFPDRVFGGFARDLDDPGICSLDRFAYLKAEPFPQDASVPETWSVADISPSILRDLEQDYARRSGGLFLKVLGRDALQGNPLEGHYAKWGFLRQCKGYALVEGSEVLAVFVVNRTDFGLNLSSLLNSITVFVLEPEAVSWDGLMWAVREMGLGEAAQDMPVLVFPHDGFVGADGYPEKDYFLWIYDLRHVGLFKRYLQKRFRVQFWE